MECIAKHRGTRVLNASMFPVLCLYLGAISFYVISFYVRSAFEKD